MIIGSYPLVPISSLVRFTDLALYFTIYSLQFIFRLSITLWCINSLHVISFTIHRDNTIVGFTIDSYHCAYLLSCDSSYTHTPHRINASFAFILESRITKLTLLHISHVSYKSFTIYKYTYINIQRFDRCLFFRGKRKSSGKRTNLQ